MNKKRIITLGSIVISGGCLGFVVHKLLSDTSWIVLLKNIQFANYTALYAGIVILLLLLNWYVEAVKWQICVSSLHRLPINESLISVLLGLAIGMLTPNRVGEIGGRALIFPKDKRPTVVLLAGISSFFQLLATILGGLGAIVFLGSKSFISMHSLPFVAFGISLFVLISIVILVKKINSVAWLFSRIAAFCSIRLEFDRIQFSARSYRQLFLFSLLRYGIFLVQFYCIVRCLSVDLPFLMSSAALALAYLISAIIPSWAISDLGIKSASVLLVLHNPDQQICVIAVLLLWIINVAIPSTIGSLLLIKHKTTNIFSNE